MIDFTNFMGPVINQQSFDKLSLYLEDIKKDSKGTTSILVGGNCILK